MINYFQISVLFCVLNGSLLRLQAAPIPPVIDDQIQQVRLVGDSRVSILFFDLYHAYLYAPEGNFSEDGNFALRLHYLRSIKGRVIAEQAIEEMRKQGIKELKLAAWYQQLKDFFPDVEVGSELIGVFREEGITRFYEGDRLLGEILDPEFGKSFSDIWLGEKTRKPHVRNQLMGEEASS